MLFRFTVRSVDTPPRFAPSAFVLPFDGRLEADEFAFEVAKKYAFFAHSDNPPTVELHVSPVAYKTPQSATPRRLYPL